MALGSPEVTLMEQVNAYRTLANGGEWRPLRITPSTAGQEEPRRVLNAEAAFIVSDILADRAGRGITFGLDNPLATRYWSAVKTGTSKDMRDNWCIGYSRRYTVGVWVGNFEGDSMHDVSGVTGAAPVWLEIMNALHANQPSESPAAPPGVRVMEVRFEPAIEHVRREWFIVGTETPVVLAPATLHGRNRIESPPRGAVIALDPDIPARNQAILFVSRSISHPVTVWELDGVVLGQANGPRKWLPTPGPHRLRLLGRSGEVVDEMAFQVRGR
jgi:penicillin-binding protein 1C